MLPERVRHLRPRAALAAVGTALAIGGCGAPALSSSGQGPILAVGAENEYANVISQIGGKYVTVFAIESNPSTDPHTFEASASVAQAVASARLVVQNGLGYDAFMNRIESATPSAGRTVIDVQRLLGLPDSTANPHLWYSPRAMPAVATAIAEDLAALAPGHAAYFRSAASRFDHSLEPWRRALASFRSGHRGAAVATTEPVADYMLEAAGTRIATPFSLQADIMNGTDPAPQSISIQSDLISRRRVGALLYNEQVTDTLTQTFLAAARRARVPVVGVYETMPQPGYDYQSWMMAELGALERAVATGTSTPKLGGSR
jgi:zinc/manganese transport system substrate-binding protein